MNRDVQRIMTSDAYEQVFPSHARPRRPHERARRQAARSGAARRRRSEDLARRTMDLFEIPGHRGSLVSAGVDKSISRQPGRRRDHRRPLRQARGRRQPGRCGSGSGIGTPTTCTRGFRPTPGSCSRTPAGTATTWRAGCCGRWPTARRTNGRSFACRPSARKGPAIRATSRQPGEVLWPSFKSAAELEIIRQQDARAYAALYQQNPADACGAEWAGGIVRRLDLGAAGEVAAGIRLARGLRRCQQGPQRQAGRLLGDRVRGRRQGPAALRRRRAGADSPGPDRPQDDPVLRREAARDRRHRGRAVPGVAGPRVPPAVRRALAQCAGRCTR